MNMKALYEAVGEILGEERKNNQALVKDVHDQITQEIARRLSAIELKAGPAGRDGTDGVAGEPGQPGRDGKNGRSIVRVYKSSETAAMVELDDGQAFEIELPVGKEGPVGLPGRGIKSFLQVNEETLIVTFTDGEAIDLLLPRGKQGDPGQDGTSVSPDEVAEVILDKHLDQVRGPKGDAGENGLDAPVIEVRNLLHDATIARGTIGSYAGGLFQAKQIAYGTPEQDPDAYRCILRGVDKVEIGHDWKQRKISFVIRLSDGVVSTHQMDMLPGLVPPVDGIRNLTGDFYLDGSTLKIFNNGEWFSFELKGPKGDPGPEGPRGRKGMQGVSVDELVFAGSTLHTIMSDGNKKEAEFIPPSTEPVPGEIKRFAGPYKANTRYAAGDVVSTAAGPFLAVSEGIHDLSSKAWVPMFTSPIVSG